MVSVLTSPDGGAVRNPVNVIVGFPPSIWKAVLKLELWPGVVEIDDATPDAVAGAAAGATAGADADAGADGAGAVNDDVADAGAAVFPSTIFPRVWMT